MVDFQVAGLVEEVEAVGNNSDEKRATSFFSLSEICMDGFSSSRPAKNSPLFTGEISTSLFLYLTAIRSKEAAGALKMDLLSLIETMSSTKISLDTKMARISSFFSESCI